MVAIPDMGKQSPFWLSGKTFPLGYRGVQSRNSMPRSREMHLKQVFWSQYASLKCQFVTLNTNKQTFKVKKQFNSMQNPDDLQQIFLSQKQSHIYIHAPIPRYTHINQQQSLVMQAKLSMKMKVKKKKRILTHIIKHFFLLYIASYKYDRIRETGEYSVTKSAKIYKERVIMTSFFLLYIENKFCFFV